MSDRRPAESVAAPVRIAMWSGPRNISTALLRSFGNRPDTFVCDEPLYAHYLLRTGIEHPGRDRILARHETDWRKVAAWLTGPVPEGRRIFYQKHMSHHLLPEIGRDWLEALSHAFLIREPREMLTSLIKVYPQPRIEDTGLPQQWELVQSIRTRSGAAPPILDARDVLEQPRAMLERLCAALAIPFTDAMLSWPAGPRPTDGVWAPYWYDAVEKSTGFQPYRPKNEPVPPALTPLLAQAEAIYGQLHSLRIRPPSLAG